MPVNLKNEEDKIADIEQQIQDRAKDLLKSGECTDQGEALDQVKDEIVEQNSQAIADSIAILKGELASIGTERDKELDHPFIEEDEKQKKRIQDILDEIERVTGMR